jgi:hypothetical protein
MKKILLLDTTFVLDLDPELTRLQTDSFANTTYNVSWAPYACGSQRVATLPRNTVLLGSALNYSTKSG